MVQKIQNLVMDAIDNKNSREVIKTKLTEVSKDLHDLESKSQIIVEENVKLKGELMAMYGFINDNKNMTFEKINILNESQIFSIESNIQKMKELEDNVRNKSLALKNNDRAITTEIEVLKDEMNATLQGSVDIARRVEKTEDMLKRILVSFNISSNNVRVDVNHSKWILSKVLSKNCLDILRKYPTLLGRDGLYTVFIASEEKLVYCDMSTDGGGWTAIQRRLDETTDFYRTWVEYKQGFGDPSKNYWIGNDAVFELTKNKDQELRVWLQSFDGDEAYSQYHTFYVGDEDSKYRLTVTGYSGTAGDSVAWHSGMKFTTKDQDNDNKISGNCAVDYHGGWWYNNCLNSNLNGEYAQSNVTGSKYPIWYHWKKRSEALKKTMMMIRHKN
ncbi:ficolin-3-like [Saccostrea echinata]|uniref:ficolin-3-like n=1 Tax=Saccostrea echinata TaxID=191078 RepID=UPI002A812420|nr:ficolin-3-like [Saccostrea echinata]